MSSGPPPKIANAEVKELFPTPLWIVDLAPEEYGPLNATINAEIERLLTPRPTLPRGANWQTDQTLHDNPKFARLVELVQAAARGAMRWMSLEHLPLVVTGCWANINPPGAFHPRHTHPNNFLSGVYYSKAGAGAAEIMVSDPRPQAHVLMPQPKQFTLRTANSAGIPVKDGRILIFPSWLHHHVMPNQTDADRISIAFNMMIPQYTETLSAPMWKGNVAAKK